MWQSHARVRAEKGAIVNDGVIWVQRTRSHGVLATISHVTHLVGRESENEESGFHVGIGIASDVFLYGLAVVYWRPMETVHR